MLDTGPEHPVTFRKETAALFFHQYVRPGESCVLVGLPGSGLQRFVDFLARPDVQMHYLSPDTNYHNGTLLLKVDCKRIHEISEWGLGELLLTALVEGCNLRPNLVDLQPGIKDLRKDVIVGKNALLAQRHLEQAIATLVQRANQRIYFVLSSFDHLYRHLPDLALNHLRALRDAHRYAVNFALCLHQFPEQIRPNSSDLLSAWMAHNVQLVGPYAEEDARRMIEQLESRKGLRLTEAQRQQILELSGRHAGLITGIFSALVAQDGADGLLPWKAWIEDQSQTPSPALVECRRLWNGLTDEEQQGLALAAITGKGLNDDARRLLEGKQLITVHGEKAAVFSPLFAEFIRRQGVGGEQWKFVLDERTHSIIIGPNVINEVPRLVFQLLAYLYQNKNDVCPRDKIIDEIYQSEPDTSDMALSNLARQARRLIEVADPYQYLVTIHGVGYQLLEYPRIKERNTT